MSKAKCTIVLAALSVAAVVAGPPRYYVKKATWQDTLFASREALMRLEAQRSQAQTPVGTKKAVLGAWYLIGPFYPPKGQNGFRFAFPPEKEQAFRVAGHGESLKQVLSRPCGGRRWVRRANFVDGQTHRLAANSNGANYLYRTITTRQPTAITTYFGSDDGIKVWLNGELVLEVPRVVSPGAKEGVAKLKLRKGQNHLLVKIHNTGGDHWFYFHTKPRPNRNRSRERTRAREALWRQLATDFADSRSLTEMAWERADNIWRRDWQPGDLGELASRYVRATRIPALRKKAQTLAAKVRTAADLSALRAIYYQSRQLNAKSSFVASFNFRALELAINHLVSEYPEQYRHGKDFLARLASMKKKVEELRAAASKGDAAALEALAGLADQLAKLRFQALVAENPLLDFDKLLVVRRSETSPRLGLPQNWQGNCALPTRGYDNEIAILSPITSPNPKLTTLFKPQKGEFVGDVDLHWDADRMLFSMPGSHGRWQIWEIRTDGTGLHQVTPGEHPDVDNYDACYLPNGKIIFASTRCFQGIPCVGGGNTVANLCLLDPKTGKIRQLCFDQDHNWCPTVLNNGRVLYSRWEYSDTPHYFTRILFHMNPDGTEQMEYYGSNSYWPNSIFYARPIPGHPTKVVAIISGHHGVPRMGELVVFDPAKGKHEDEGAIQRIPGHNQPVEPIIRDGLVNGSWPKFLHPYPLSEQFFLVSCKPTPSEPWGLYLVDVFDNMVKLFSLPGQAIFEPIPLRKTPKPPVIPDRVDPSKDYATVYLNDVYFGGGLRGVPRGTIKKLRLFEFHYAYPRMGGHIHIGIDGPWDVHRILGTVPVYEDGSAFFKVPANIPIAVQPLDAEGKAVQVMRSWYTTMPGEHASCIGCHERQNASPTARGSIAAMKPPTPITPWRGPARGFSFLREVQPVLDKYCVGCHNGKPRPDGKKLPNFADTSRGWRGFINSYIALHPYVRRPGPESDYHLQKPYEWHADTSELVQMLQKGHHGVRLDAEAWDRLITWIDLNVPCHGTWSEHRQIAGKYHERRLLMRKLYANRPEDPEKYPTPSPPRPAFVKPQPEPERKPYAGKVPGWPFDAAEAKKRQKAVGLPTELKIKLTDKITLDLVLIPPGEFIMGSWDGELDEYPQCRVKIEKPFYMGKFEITNEQYALFDSYHDSGYISVFNKDQNTRGIPANRPKQPVIRVSWKEAMEFCYWLSQKTGRKFTLPTEAQWEWACRAGTATPLYYGAVDANFSKLANLADSRLVALCRRDSPKWIPHIPTANDGSVVAADVGRYPPNPFGLHDMHGNVFEWTLTTYKPYPYDPADGRDSGKPEGKKVVRGGSFYDRPKRARSAFRLAYHPWQPVFNVGIRVVCEAKPGKVLAAAIEK